MTSELPEHINETASNEETMLDPSQCYTSGSSQIEERVGSNIRKLQWKIKEK